MSKKLVLWIVGLVGVAAALRLVALGLRPPHHDEGVNGWFVEQMRLADGYYPYDPTNFHGPLYFQILYAARTSLGAGLLALRLPAAVIGVGACVLPLLLRRRMGTPAALAACALLAVSPTLVYYARYAIHETLLGALGLLMACAIARGRYILASISLAAMFATKETTLLFVLAAMPWLLVEVALARRRVLPWLVARRPRDLMMLGGVMAMFAATWIVAFTEGFQAPDGVGGAVSRSLQAFAVWGATGSEGSGHQKPIWYYASIGLRYELVLYVLALVGAFVGRRDRLIRGCSLVGFAMFGGYSLIPYKMPWLPVSWLMLLAIPAGYGAVVIALRVGHARARVFAGFAMAAALAITVRSSFVRPADPVEDLAYVHTSADYGVWMQRIDDLATRLGPRKITIGVSHPTTWPLAYSLTPYPNAHWTVFGDEDVLVVAKSRVPAVEAVLKRRYRRADYEMREYSEPLVLFVALPRLQARRR